MPSRWQYSFLDSSIKSNLGYIYRSYYHHHSNDVSRIGMLLTLPPSPPALPRRSANVPAGSASFPPLTVGHRATQPTASISPSARGRGNDDILNLYHSLGLVISWSVYPLNLILFKFSFLTFIGTSDSFYARLIT